MRHSPDLVIHSRTEGGDLDMTADFDDWRGDDDLRRCPMFEATPGPRERKGVGEGPETFTRELDEAVAEVPGVAVPPDLREFEATGSEDDRPTPGFDDGGVEPVVAGRWGRLDLPIGEDDFEDAVRIRRFEMVTYCSIEILDRHPVQTVEVLHPAASTAVIRIGHNKNSLLC
jgi:hypothetical protein